MTVVFYVVDLKMSALVCSVYFRCDLLRRLRLSVCGLCVANWFTGYRLQAVQEAQINLNSTEAVSS